MTRHFPWKEFDDFLIHYEGGTVLDLGCGNGRLLKFLDEHGYQNYLGVDHSEELLKEAKKKHGENSFLCADISDLPDLESVDAIFAIASFHHIPPQDQLKTLEAWKKLLNKEGKLYMTNWNLYQPRFLKAWCYFPRPSFRGLLIPWRKKVYRYYYAFSQRRLNRLLKKAGYNVIHQKKNNRNIITIAE